MTTFETDTRGVSVTVTHALALGITTILMTVLLVSAGTMLENNQKDAANEQLRDIGGNFAHDITRLDQLADGEVVGASGSLYTELPESISGMDYSVDVKAEDVTGSGENEAVLVLQTRSSPSVTVEVAVPNRTTWVDTTSGIQTDEIRMYLDKCDGHPYILFGSDDCP